jgi:hypothetical protein
MREQPNGAPLHSNVHQHFKVELCAALPGDCCGILEQIMGQERRGKSRSDRQRNKVHLPSRVQL